MTYLQLFADLEVCASLPLNEWQHQRLSAPTPYPSINYIIGHRHVGRIDQGTENGSIDQFGG